MLAGVLRGRDDPGGVCQVSQVRCQLGSGVRQWRDIPPWTETATSHDKRHCGTCCPVLYSAMFLPFIPLR